jgi:hypothetical protein
MARPSASGTRGAMHRLMSDSRQSPIPQDRVNENVDQAQRAKDNQAQMAEQERYLKDQGVDERPGTNPEEQPDIPDEPTGPAERGA